LKNLKAKKDRSSDQGCKRTLILHTSDLHLSEKRQETLTALDEILSKCREYKVDLLTIGGDLFDSERDAEVLRPKLRRMFDRNPFQIVAIPGNHDKEAYSSNLDFGPDLKIATTEPFEVYNYERVSIVAVPFRDQLSDQLLHELENAAKDVQTRVLLLHCTLDIGFAGQDFGEEIANIYFPVTSETLSRLRYDYVLAGHFHTQTCKKPLNGKRFFIYPGSPVSHTKKEKGKRQAVLIDTEKGETQAILLDSFYYDSVQFYVRPGKEEGTLQALKEWKTLHSADSCKLEVVVNGFLKISELEFRKALERVAEDAEILHAYRNVERVLDHPLYKRFLAKLEADEEIEDKEKVESFVIDAMSRLLAERRLRE
jgi:DNA repair exonuclease SbcCD nuclease subunit